MEFFAKFRKDDWTQRLAKARHVLQEYPSRVPVIVDRGTPETPNLKEDHHRYVVPQDHTMGQFLNILRKNLPACTSAQGLMLHTYPQNTCEPLSKTLGQVYSEFQDRDAFLYLTISLENMFGAEETGA